MGFMQSFFKKNPQVVPQTKEQRISNGDPKAIARLVAADPTQVQAAFKQYSALSSVQDKAGFLNSNPDMKLAFLQAGLLTSADYNAIFAGGPDANGTAENVFTAVGPVFQGDAAAAEAYQATKVRAHQGAGRHEADKQ